MISISRRDLDEIFESIARQTKATKEYSECQNRLFGAMMGCYISGVADVLTAFYMQFADDEHGPYLSEIDVSKFLDEVEKFIANTDSFYRRGTDVKRTL